MRSGGAAEAASLRGESSGREGAPAEAGAGGAVQTEDGGAPVQARVENPAEQASVPMSRGIRRRQSSSSSVASKVILKKKKKKILLKAKYPSFTSSKHQKICTTCANFKCKTEEM